METSIWTKPPKGDESSSSAPFCWSLPFLAASVKPEKGLAPEALGTQLPKEPPVVTADAISGCGSTTYSRPQRPEGNMMSSIRKLDSWGLTSLTSNGVSGGAEVRTWAKGALALPFLCLLDVRGVNNYECPGLFRAACFA